PLTPTDAFLRDAEAMQLAFDEGDLERLGLFLALLLERNRQFNLTAIRSPEEAWTRHVLDALSLVPVIASCDAGTLADVGSGGGLPGVPLAIVLPEIAVTLIEATGKKAGFLREVTAQLGLDNVSIVNDRAETVGHAKAHRGGYDVVTARALGPLRVLLELTLPLARTGGLVLAIKGEQAPREIEEAATALRILRAEVVTQQRTPTGTIVAVRKLAGTPKRYPRRPGEPKHSPL
ncbi:MAG: 16S rRNA (guanine(527)-N(7))-methyltransferase RsmG, partial [Planctomycetota bacterium]